MLENVDGNLRVVFFIFFFKVGSGGAGYIWSACEGGREEEWRHSVAPIPKDKLAEISQAEKDNLDQLDSNDGSNPPSGELQAPSNNSNFHNTEESMDDYLLFEKEVHDSRFKIFMRQDPS